MLLEAARKSKLEKKESAYVRRRTADLKEKEAENEQKRANHYIHCRAFNPSGVDSSDLSFLVIQLHHRDIHDNIERMADAIQPQRHATRHRKHILVHFS